MNGRKSICILLAMFMAMTVCSACKPEEQPIDNTEGSLDHTPIYYWSEGNVPYDEDDDCQTYCFITPYLAAKPTGGAVVVFPGGGYHHLSNDSEKGGTNNDGDQKEASSMAPWLNEAGISLFIVNYRTTSVDATADYRHFLSDGTRAMRYIRYHAAQYYLDTDKIAAMGYSAGGHLASMMLTKYEWQIADETYVTDAVDGVSAKANAGIFGYSVLSFADGSTHNATRKRFTADDPSLYDTYSPEKTVNTDMGPCFVWHEEGDTDVPATASYAFASAAESVNVRVDLHIFNDVSLGTGLHGIGVAQEFEYAKEWPKLATEFLRSLDF